MEWDTAEQGQRGHGAWRWIN